MAMCSNPMFLTPARHWRLYVRDHPVKLPGLGSPPGDARDVSLRTHHLLHFSWDNPIVPQELRQNPVPWVRSHQSFFVLTGWRSSCGWPGRQSLTRLPGVWEPILTLKCPCLLLSFSIRLLCFKINLFLQAANAQTLSNARRGLGGRRWRRAPFPANNGDFPKSLLGYTRRYVGQL